MAINEIDNVHYTAVRENCVVYMRFKLNLSVTAVGLSPPDEIATKVEGTLRGVVRRLTASSLAKLMEARIESKIDYEVESKPAGKLGEVRQPVLRLKEKQMEKQFAERLRAAFEPLPEIQP